MRSKALIWICVMTIVVSTVGTTYACCQFPIASFTAPSSVCVDSVASFNASASWDPDGTELTYEWAFGAGAYGITGAYTANPTCKYSSSGTKTVWLTVTDDDDPECCWGQYGCSDKSNSTSRTVTVVGVSSVTSDKNSPVICENVTFTVTTNPSGYGYLVSWSGGGTPATGSGSTFTTHWPCAGGKTVAATCGGSSKSKNVTVSLPDGCFHCSEPIPPEPWVGEAEESACTYCNEGDAGKCGVFDNPSEHTYTLKTPCYNDCNWYAYLDSVNTMVYICRSCPYNFPTVACLSEVADMNEAEACAHEEKFHDPVQPDDIDSSTWCRDCVVVHEETHMNKDWVEDSLKPEIESFTDWCANHPIDIDCNVSDSTNCASALTASLKENYDEEWGRRVTAAIVTWNTQGEGDANAAELACYQEILNALKAKCP